MKQTTETKKKLFSEKVNWWGAQMERSENFAEKALASLNRRPFLKDHDEGIDDLDELAECMELQDFRAAILGEYGLIPTDATRSEIIARYNLSENAENRERNFLTRIGESAKRFFNPLYNYNINGVTQEVQTDLAYRLAEIHHAEHTLPTADARDAAIKETIKNAQFRETKDILLAYVLENDKVDVQVPEDLVTQNQEEERALLYNTLRQETLTAHDKVFTQGRQAAAIDLAVYGRAALVAGPVGILGAYLLRASVGTVLGTINSHVGKIAAAGSLYAVGGFTAVATAYVAKGVFDYIAHHEKGRSEATHTYAKWVSGGISYLMPFIAGADSYMDTVHSHFSGNSASTAGSNGGDAEKATAPVAPPITPVDDSRLGECPVSAHERSLETCPVNTCEAFPSLQGDIRELHVKETYVHHGTPWKGEFHELGLHLDKKEFDEGFVTLKGLHDNHTPNSYDVDKTKIMAEGYDASGKLAFRQLYDVDAQGKFTLPGFDETQYKNWQITWAEAECKNDTLHLTDLASYTHGKVPVDGFVSLPETSHAHLPVEQHAFDIRYHEIPQDSNEQLVIGVHDSFGDGIEYNTHITDASGNLVEFTRLKHAPGVTDAIQSGYIPEFTHGGQYHLQSWGHDFPQLAGDSEPELGWYIHEVPLSSGLSLQYIIVPESSLVQLPEENLTQNLVAPEFFGAGQTPYQQQYHTL